MKGCFMIAFFSTVRYHAFWEIIKASFKLCSKVFKDKTSVQLSICAHSLKYLLAPFEEVMRLLQTVDILIAKMVQYGIVIVFLLSKFLFRIFEDYDSISRRIVTSAQERAVNFLKKDFAPNR